VGFSGKFGGAQQVLLTPTRPGERSVLAVLAMLVIVFTYVSNYTVLWKPYKDSEKSLG